MIITAPIDTIFGMPRLIILSGPAKGREYDFKDNDEIVVGRSSQNKVPIPDLLASRQHARILNKGGAWKIEDLGSKNGIKINGVLCKQGALKFDDELEVGQTLLKFTASAAGALVGRDFSGYKLLEKVGEGGMGEVYRAHQKSLDRIVAIKILSDRMKKDAATVERFITEARRAGALNHPHIIHVHDVGQTEEGIVYFSMEYVDGQTLKDWMASWQQGGEAPPLQALCQVFSKVAQALHYAHTHGVIHRDIKPDNIMLTANRDVKLADLGIAFSIGESPVPPESNDGKRKVLGTPHYMAPEQILARPSDGRLDIYALGATAYHAMTGQTLFRGKTAQDIIKAHLKIPPTAPSILNDEIPDELEALLMRMLEKKPSDRPPQARDVAEAFEACASGFGGAKKGVGLFGKLRKPKSP